MVPTLTFCWALKLCANQRDVSTIIGKATTTRNIIATRKVSNLGVGVGTRLGDACPAASAVAGG